MKSKTQLSIAGSRIFCIFRDNTPDKAILNEKARNLIEKIKETIKNGVFWEMHSIYVTSSQKMNLAFDFLVYTVFSQRMIDKLATDRAIKRLSKKESNNLSLKNLNYDEINEYFSQFKMKINVEFKN